MTAQETYTVWNDDAPSPRTATLETSDVRLARLEASTFRQATICIKRPGRGFMVHFELWRDGQRWNTRGGGGWEWVSP